MKTREYAGQDRKEVKRISRTPAYQKLAQRAKQTTEERDKATRKVKA